MRALSERSPSDEGVVVVGVGGLVADAAYLVAVGGGGVYGIRNPKGVLAMSSVDLASKLDPLALPSGKRREDAAI